MGKDHELLEAARNGNIGIVEKILLHKSKKTGPLASLRRGPGSNVQDSSGYSGLHHAALNGHIEIVCLLLQHDAETNLPDSRGSSPLHLAAWAGHQDIIKILLTHPYHPANPNFQTIDKETPLHCAAQHGHTGVLTTLLAHGADPNIPNFRGETSLDLAAQYGRLQAVQMLIRAHPELLKPFQYESTEHLSPLHLASRNGHTNVVEVLLSAGVNVNILTSSGTALHEAALCGKDPVVKTLLDAGADLDATDNEGRTAMDLLEQFPPHVTKRIVSVINNHKNSTAFDPEFDQFEDGYDYKHIGKAHWNSNDEITNSSSMKSPLSPLLRPRASTTDTPGVYVSMAPIRNASNSPTPPKKPPRRNLSGPTPNSFMSTSLDNSNHGLKNSSAYEFLYLAKSGTRSAQDDSKLTNKNQYVEMNPIVPRPAPRQTKKSTNYENSCALRVFNPNRKLRRNRDSNYESHTLLNATTHIAAQKSPTTPLSPTNYNQPPTPEHPPPSAGQAETFIHDCIRPLSQEYKRRSGIRDFIEIGTSPDHLCPPSLGASSGSLSSSISLSDRSISTDCVEEFVEDVPFAGLFKGSTMTLDALNQLHISKNYKQNVITESDMSNAQSTSTNESSTSNYNKQTISSVLSPFDEQEEWAKISEIMASFGAGLLEDSTLVNDIENDIDTRFAIHPPETDVSSIHSWLLENGLICLELKLMENGYDDINFINGILEESDLIVMHISKEDGVNLMKAVNLLPKALPLKIKNNLINNNVISVEQWLKTIKLEEYSDIFRKHLYTEMDRICRVWEIELQAVLEINKVGHRKRILNSVADKKEKTPKQQIEPIKTRTLRKKNRPAPKPPIAANLEIRAPSELLLGVPSGLKAQWRHSASTLLSGCIKYNANYLGSTLVKELRGTESTRKSIQKFKKGERSCDGANNLTNLNQNNSINKRAICLAISYRGVEFIDVGTQGKICDHEIKNIDCACQDSDDLTHFAYITKESDFNTHYCHVFNVDSMDLATEIILTLGQAFEVAYQLALRDVPTSPERPKTFIETTSKLC